MELEGTIKRIKSYIEEGGVKDLVFITIMPKYEDGHKWPIEIKVPRKIAEDLHIEQEVVIGFTFIK